MHFALLDRFRQRYFPVTMSPQVELAPDHSRLCTEKFGWSFEISILDDDRINVS